MPAKLRNRVVVFRLTQEEYALLKQACTWRGGLSVSEFTRMELLTAIQQGTNAERRDLGAIVEELSLLRASVDRLFTLLAGRAGRENVRQAGR